MGLFFTAHVLKQLFKNFQKSEPAIRSGDLDFL